MGVIIYMYRDVKVMMNLLRDAKQAPLTSGGFRGSVTYILFKTSYARAAKKGKSCEVHI